MTTHKQAELLNQEYARVSFRADVLKSVWSTAHSIDIAEISESLEIIIQELREIEAKSKEQN